MLCYISSFGFDIMLFFLLIEFFRIEDYPIELYYFTPKIIFQMRLKLLLVLKDIMHKLKFEDLC